MSNRAGSVALSAMPTAEDGGGAGGGATGTGVTVADGRRGGGGAVGVGGGGTATAGPGDVRGVGLGEEVGSATIAGPGGSVGAGASVRLGVFCGWVGVIAAATVREGGVVVGLFAARLVAVAVTMRFVLVGAAPIVGVARAIGIPVGGEVIPGRWTYAAKRSDPTKRMMLQNKAAVASTRR